MVEYKVMDLHKLNILVVCASWASMLQVVKWSIQDKIRNHLLQHQRQHRSWANV